MNNKRLFTISGIAMIASSAVTILDYAERKKKEKGSCLAQLIAGAVGVLAGVALAYEPKRQEKLPVDKTEFFEGNSADTATEKIQEVLGDTAVKGNQPIAKAPSAIEVDNETSIEDFI